MRNSMIIKIQVTYLQLVLLLISTAVVSSKTTQFSAYSQNTNSPAVRSKEGRQKLDHTTNTLVDRKSVDATLGRAFNNQQQSFDFNPNSQYQTKYQTLYSRQQRPPLGAEKQWSPASYSEVRRIDDSPPNDHKDLPDYLDHPPSGYEETPPEDTPAKEEKSEPTEPWDGYHGHDAFPEVVYDHDPHHDEVIVTTTTTEPPPAPVVPHLSFNKLISRKLILVNLYFAIFFIAYCIFLMLRSVARKKVNFPNRYTRSIQGLPDVFTTLEKFEVINEIAGIVMPLIHDFMENKNKRK